MGNGLGMHTGIAWTVFFNLVNSIVNICNDANTENESELQPSKLEDENARKVSSIDPTLLQNLEAGEPPFQLFGKFGQSKSMDEDVKNDLTENIRKQQKMCNENEGVDNNNTRCSYSWLASRMANFGKQELHVKMSKDLLVNNGWAAEGYPIRQPREGWYTHTPNATFSIKIENIIVDTKYLVIFSMKSYSLKWKNSKL